MHGFSLVKSAELPTLRVKGLLERLRCVNNIKPFTLYAFTLYSQYLSILCAVHLLRAFPSDIAVCIYRKQASAS